MTQTKEGPVHFGRRFGRAVYAAGRCLHCKKWVTAQTRRQWQRAVREPCPHCRRRGW